MNIKRIEKPVLQQFLDESALLTGEGVVEYEKYIKDYAGAYMHADVAKDMNVLAYKVQSFSGNGDQALNWGVTNMEPVTVNGEYNITRGHFHLDRNQPEFYLCAAGEGYLIKWDGQDEVILERMTRGSLHWIEGKYAHRMVNTGKTTLRSLACWPKSAGHDYKAIEDQGFPVRLFDDNGEVKVVPVHD